MSSIILASASPRRKDLLEALGVTFEVIPSAAEEHTESSSGPDALARINAQLKAEAIADDYPERWVLGSDTVVALGEQVYGKPADLEVAQSMLQALSGQTHCVHSGVSLVCRAHEVVETWSETTRVTMRSLSPAQIADYLSRIQALDKAGAYAIQEDGERIIGRVEGSLSNVVGLPLESLEKVLVRHGLLALPSA